MSFDPKDPFFAAAVERMIDERLGQSRAGALIRQLQGSLAGASLAYGYQAFSGFSLAQYAFRTVTITHNIGRVPDIYFPFIAPQDASASVQIATFKQGTMAANTMDVTLSNPYNFSLTNALLGWLVLYK